MAEQAQLIQQATSRGQQIRLVARLSIPAILAELSAIVMQYIDAAMVGSLGATASAAIGLVTSTSWLLGGLCISAATGFSVQVAQLVGADKMERAQAVFGQSLVMAVAFGACLSLTGILISPHLPVWLGGAAELQVMASQYFFIFSCALLATQFRQLAGSMLQCSGDMKTPSALNMLMCLLDVIFNVILIFPTRQIAFWNGSMTVFGVGLGVPGAALGTALSEVIVAVLMMGAACRKFFGLKFFGLNGPAQVSWRPQATCYSTAAYIALPIAFEHTALCGAQIALTHIIAPLGTVAMAANTLAVTAESLCYMPGYGIGSAATTLVGQSLGAGKTHLARSYAWLSVGLGVTLMTATGVLMYLLAPCVFAALTPDDAVRALGTQVLRIEAFAEPLYAASIVAAGALRGAGDTRVPSLLNLVSMWGVRLTAASFLAPRLGLRGVWLAMCGELCVRGVLFLLRLGRGAWLRQRILQGEEERCP